MGGTERQAPTGDNQSELAHTTGTQAPPTPAAVSPGLWVWRSPPVLVLWYSGSPPLPHSPGPEPAAPGPPSLGTRVERFNF